MSSILVTGARRGIGRALVDAYAHRGDSVIATCRGAPPRDDRVEWHGLDVTDPAGHDALARALDGRPIELLVCNAGIFPDKGNELETGYPAAMWAETFATNVTGVFLTIRSLQGNLRLAQAPRIAIMSSIMGSHERAPGGAYIYRASKAAVLNLGRNLATDLAPSGIAVGVYHPGWVRTDMGGPTADIGLAQSVTGLMTRFDTLSLEGTGTFEAWDGTPLPY